MGDEKHDGMTEERIPGERDPGTATHSEAGIIAGTGYGEDIPPGQPDTMDERTRRERALEGGGATSQRPSSRGQR
jgi:hypothetical protein